MAVTAWPAPTATGTVWENGEVPFAVGVSVNEPIGVCPSPKPDGSHDGLTYSWTK